MARFYEKCVKLRDSYTLTPTTDSRNCNLKLQILSKLVALSFYDSYTQKGLDDLPICEQLVLDCSDVQFTYADIESVLMSIFRDLDSYEFAIRPVEPFNMTHKICFYLS